MLEMFSESLVPHFHGWSVEERIHWIESRETAIHKCNATCPVGYVTEYFHAQIYVILRFIDQAYPPAR